MAKFALFNQFIVATVPAHAPILSKEEGLDGTSRLTYLHLKIYREILPYYYTFTGHYVHRNDI